MGMKPRKLILRPEIQWFAEQMERKLRKNDWKGGWQDDTEESLLERIQEELDEAKEAYENLRDERNKLICCRDQERIDKLKRELINELADVANMAMMVADITK